MKFKVKKTGTVAISTPEVIIASNSLNTNGNIWYNEEQNKFYRLKIGRIAGSRGTTHIVEVFNFIRNNFDFVNSNHSNYCLAFSPTERWYRATATEIKEPEVVDTKNMENSIGFNYLHADKVVVWMVVRAKRIDFLNEFLGILLLKGSNVPVSIDKDDLEKVKNFCLEYGIKVTEKPKPKPEPIEYQILTLLDGTKFKVKDKDIIGYSTIHPDHYHEIVFNLNGVRFDLTTDRQHPGIKFEHVTETVPPKLSLKERLVEKLKAKTPLKIKVTPKTSEWVQKICFENQIFWLSDTDNKKGILRYLNTENVIYFYTTLENSCLLKDVSKENGYEEFIIDEKEI